MHKYQSNTSIDCKCEKSEACKCANSSHNLES